MFNRILVLVSLHVSSILINQDEKSVLEAELFFLYFNFLKYFESCVTLLKYIFTPGLSTIEISII